ncbi:MAG: ribonuclease HII [Candidatus Omnitrophica bacterium CG_4_9_14_0_2_um_filter_42_8]|nr:MAG: ribonuclease HII [Candidatus Omnitrophica bacterium CG_4_9_14_0_2_um_filter_42_8]
MLSKARQMLAWEKKALLEGASIVIGVDEAGRGPLAGPVVAGAVILKSPDYKTRIDDSKKLRPLQREKAFREIREKAFFGVGIKDNKYIDRENIHMATLAAMKQAVKNLVSKFCRLTDKKEKNIRKDICVLVDGLFGGFLPYKTIPIVKGDSKSLTIATASIVAKVTRDAIMKRYDKLYPRYGFSKHKGYGTKNHLEALGQYGPCPIHRKTFAPLKNDIRQN